MAVDLPAEAVDEFMHRYLRERARILRMEDERLRPFRDTFYSESCKRDRRSRIIEECDSEVL